MKKIIIHKPGGYKRLEIEEKPDLVSSDEVIVDVAYFGVNYADVLVRWGVYESAKQFVGWPITPGFEFSGLVRSVPNSEDRLKVGDRVFGVTRFNAYASQVAVPATQLFPVPDEMDLKEAAAFPVIFMTAYHALLQNVVTRPGMTALVHSAAGGVGSALIQLCRVKGIRAIGVVGSSHKIATVEKFGAEVVLTKDQLWKRVEELFPNGLDLIFDANGSKSLKHSYDHLATGGKLIAYGAHTMFPKIGGKVNWPKLIKDYLQTPRFNPLSMTSENKSLITFNLSFLFPRKDLFREAMVDLMLWLQDGKILLPPISEFEFQDIAKAHAALESGQTIGKIVIKV